MEISAFSLRVNGALLTVAVLTVEEPMLTGVADQ